jgi:glutamate-ammonia-ligase adenylyltransferase
VFSSERTDILLPGHANDPAVLLEHATAFSRFALRQLQANPHLAQEPFLHPYSPEDMRLALVDGGEDENSLRQSLRHLRQKVILRLLVRDLGGRANLTEVMATVSSLAEVCLQHAVTRLDGKLRQQYGTPLSVDGQSEQGLHVIGMGKLGGGELNVSSDIDLVFAYPEEGDTSGPNPISNHEYFTRLCKKLVSVLHDITEDGQVFRVDMRLRPYGDSGPLVSSFDMIEEYFYTQGREWERYAWVKARTLTGHQGEMLMKMVAPFVFRRHLDFSALGSLRDLHAQIRQEVQRRDTADDIKLGPGGIREVEFMAQLFQLIRGGRNTALRTRPTLVTLQVLGEQGLLPTEAVKELCEGYAFLRNVEHRLQYLDDRQTQVLPQDGADRDRIARSMGVPDWPAFLARLQLHRDRITRLFESIFSGNGGANEAPALAPVWSPVISEEEAAERLQLAGYRAASETFRRIREFRTSGRYLRMAASTQARLDSLIPRLMESAAQSDGPDETFERLLGVIESIGRRESYLALLVEYESARAHLTRLASASPWAAQYLAQHPILLDELISAPGSAAPDWDGLKAWLRRNLDETEGNAERQMDILRHFKHTQTFRLLVQDLAGTLAVETLSDHLSDLATVIIGEVLPLAWRAVRTRHCETPKFAVIGYGKLGGKELGYASDLDIIFLYDDEAPDAQENYARLAQRLNTWLSSTTTAGLLYETDLRLRPNGASGLLVSSLAAYREYELGSAWVWEHQALTRARFVAGDRSIGDRFEELRQEVLRKDRSHDPLRLDVSAMRLKMLEGHPNSSGLLDIKHDRGGIVDVEFVVQYVVLGFAHQYPELTANIGNLALLHKAGELALLPAGLAETVRDAYREFRRLQHALRLQGSHYARVDPAAVLTHTSAVKALWQSVFGAPEPLNQQPEPARRDRDVTGETTRSGGPTSGIP